MLTLRRYWHIVQNHLEEKDCYSPDEFELWIHQYKYNAEFMRLRLRCYDALHALPGADNIAVSYMDIGNCLGAAYVGPKLIILNPFHLLHNPEFTFRTIIPHEYVHVMLGDSVEGHTPEFFDYFEAVTGFKHPSFQSFLGRNTCKFHLETMRNLST